MSQSSSTSSSDAHSPERAPHSRVPLAALALVLGVAAVELLLAHLRPWYADLAAWQWQTKESQIAAGTLDGHIAVFGSSVLFHGFDAAEVNRLSRSPAKVVNLALNGSTLQHQAQQLERFLATSQQVRLVVLELRSVEVWQGNWLTGPFWRQIASYRDFLTSRFYFWEPSLLVSFASNRLLGSFAYRQALDNWLSQCVRSGRLERATLERNRQVEQHLAAHLGFWPNFEEEISMHPGDPIPNVARPWCSNRAGEIWLTHFLDAAVRKNIRVALIQPPSPPFVIQQRRAPDFNRHFENYVLNLRQKYPTLGLEVVWPTGYALEDFRDEVHFSRAGRIRLTHDLAKWVASLDNRFHHTDTIAPTDFSGP